MYPSIPPKKTTDTRMVFSHKNLQRWALFSPKGTKGRGMVRVLDRVLERRDEKGNLIDRCTIGTVSHNNKLHTLTTEHGNMWNVIEALHDRYRPPDGVLKIRTPDFFDFVVDSASMNDPSRRKHRDSVEYRNYMYHNLSVMAKVPIAIDDWREKDGTGGPHVFKLLSRFKIFGLVEGAQRGIIEIEIDPVVAAGLRAKHTAPILVEVANSLKAPMAWVLYRYLDKVLAKRKNIQLSIWDLASRLAIDDRRDALVHKMVIACQEIEGKDITSGRILSCKLEKREKTWWLNVIRGPRITVKPQSQVLPMRFQEDKRFNDYVMRFDALSPEERVPLQEKINAELAANRFSGQPGKPGYEMTRQSIIAAVMEEYLMKKIDKATYGYCTEGEPLIAREATPNESRIRALRCLAAILREVGKYAA